MATTPRLDISEDGGQRRILVLGDWRLNELLRGHNDAMEQLESLQVRPNDIWDLSALESLDSAGALLFWRCWHGKKPRNLQGASEHERWLERFANVHLERPALPGRFTRFVRLIPRLGAHIAGFARQCYGVILCGGQFLVDLWHCVENPRLFPAGSFPRACIASAPSRCFSTPFSG